MMLDGTEYANGLAEAKTALEAELAALKEQSTAGAAVVVAAAEPAAEEGVVEAESSGWGDDAGWGSPEVEGEGGAGGVSDLFCGAGAADAASGAESAGVLAEVQAELASIKETLEESQQANVQWTEYANGLAEEKTALEAELAALKEQVAVELTAGASKPTEDKAA